MKIKNEKSKIGNRHCKNKICKNKICIISVFNTFNFKRCNKLKGRNKQNQAFIYWGTMFLRYIIRFKDPNTWKSSITLQFQPKLPFSNFLNPHPVALLLLQTSPFLFQLSRSQLELGGYLSHLHSALPFHERKERLRGAFIVQADHSAFKVANVRQEISLIRR